MNSFSLSLRRLRSVCTERVSLELSKSCSREPRAPTFGSRAEPRASTRSARGALALTFALGVMACGDSGEPALTGQEAGAPAFVGPTGGTAFDAGLVPGSGLAPGQAYTLDSGFAPGSFGGTNGSGTTVQPLGGTAAVGGLTAGGLTAGAGLTAGGGGTAPIGGLAGIFGGTASTGGTTAGGFGGIPGFVGGGMTGPVTPLDPSVKVPAKIPAVNGACPNFSNGSTSTVAGIRVKFWSGSGGKGPLIFYWHGTGGSSDEAVGGLTGDGLGPVLSQITAQGGIVAAPDDSTGTGNAIDTVVWTTDDFKAADQIVACAVQAGRIDPGRIHALGFSAGGLMAGAMYYLRSDYMASIVTYSGGTSPWPGNSTPQDPSNKLPILMFHGGDSDWVGVGFKAQSEQLAADAKAKGRMAILCDHGFGHTIPSGGPAAAWAFFKAHPYNTPSPWGTTLPSSVPSYCKIH